MVSRALAARALADAERGDARAVPAALAALAPGYRPWSVALRAALEALAPAGAVDVAELKLAPGGGDDERRVLGRAAALLARAALLALDGRRLEALAGALARLAGDTDPAGRACATWAALLAGAPADAAAVEAIARDAARDGDGARLVEAAVLRALAVADQDEALGLARRASRMAQAEESPWAEGLAHLVLARLRRRTGRGHLALHVLAAFAAQAAPVFHPWVAWELLLAGDEAGARALLDRVQGAGAHDTWTRLARAGIALVDAARRADRACFDAAGAALAAAGVGWRAVREEVTALPALLDPGIAASSDEVTAWRAGARAAVPLGLGAFAAAGDQPVACVLVAPGGGGRRALSAGAPLAPAPLPLSREAGDDAGGLRTETALAALALAGPVGLPRERFFREVYGFAYDHERHDGVLKVLLHRVRVRLGAAGALERGGDDRALVLVPAGPLAIPDPRSDPPPEARMLRAVAALRGADTQTIADALQIPLRTVQRRLRQLVEEGACRSDRREGVVVYSVQDTTFTTVSLRAAPRP